MSRGHLTIQEERQLTCDDSSDSLILCKRKKRKHFIFVSCDVNTHILDPIVIAGSVDRSHSETVGFVQRKRTCITNRQ